MQLNTFSEVMPLLREKKSNIDFDAVSRFLGHYRSGHFIYPGAMHRSLKMPIIDVYEVLEICAENGYIEQCMEVYCPYCRRFTENIYKTLMEIPDELYCPHCDNVIEDPSRYAIIIYRVK